MELKTKTKSYENGVMKSSPLKNKENSQNSLREKQTSSLGKNNLAGWVSLSYGPGKPPLEVVSRWRQEGGW